MPSIADFKKYGEELETMMRLRTSPIAVKMLEKEADIPEGSLRPWKFSQNASRRMPASNRSVDRRLWLGNR